MALEKKVWFADGEEPDTAAFDDTNETADPSYEVVANPDYGKDKGQEEQAKFNVLQYIVEHHGHDWEDWEEDVDTLANQIIDLYRKYRSTTGSNWQDFMCEVMDIEVEYTLLERVKYFMMGRLIERVNTMQILELAKRDIIQALQAKQARGKDIDDRDLIRALEHIRDSMGQA